MFEEKMAMIINNINPTTWIISNADFEYIAKAFKLKKLSIEELRELRDNVVVFFQEENIEDKSEVLHQIKYLTSITHCIDVHLSEKGFHF